MISIMLAYEAEECIMSIKVLTKIEVPQYCVWEKLYCYDNLFCG